MRIDRSRLRDFYNEHLAQPLGYSLLAALAVTPVFVLLRWAGLGRWYWLHPTNSFDEALAVAPGAAAVCFVVTFVMFIVFRIRL